MEILVVVAMLIALGLATLTFGYDSRDGFAQTQR